MEGNGDLMKMLMQADPPDDNIQGAMEDSAMVQSAGFAQTGMEFGSGRYGGMQQQLPTVGQQQPRGTGFHSMSPGQMIPRSPNNGMLQQNMDLMLQQQQQQQQYQQHPQSPYGNGSYQGYNGGYQSQTHAQPMGPYQGGFPSEPGYPQGAGSSQAMGEFSPQAGPNQTMGMPGPASLSLANLSAMSNRQQYYSDSYGINQPVSPVHKQMPQSGGFLQPSRMPYSPQAQSYQSSSYPKRPSSSSMQNQMQGFTSGGSFTPRSNAGMQMPSMPYQSPTSPYQPPHSPVMRSSASPVPQQDAGLYSRPREPFPQPQSPFGPSVGQFSQQQQQHSSCMFVQPDTTPSPSQYQSQQQIVGIKSAALAQRRASYPGQQSAMKMPSPTLKRSPPSPLPNSKSPDLTRGIQLGFEERGPIKAVSKKEKSSSLPGIDPSQAGVTSKVKTSVPKNMGDGHRGLPRQRRSASDVGSPSVSPPVIKKEGSDGNVTKTEEMSPHTQEVLQNPHNVERKVEESGKSNGIPQGEITSHPPNGQTGNQNQATAEKTKSEIENPVLEKPPSKAKQKNVTIKVECKESEDNGNKAEKSPSQTGGPAAEGNETKNASLESMNVNKEGGESRNVDDKVDVKPNEREELSISEKVNGKGEEVMERKNTHNTDKTTESEKPNDGDGKASKETDPACGKSGKVDDKINNSVSETGNTSDKTDIPSEETISNTGKTSNPIDAANDKNVKTGEEAEQSGNTGVEANPSAADQTVDGVSKSDASEDKEKSNDSEANKVQTEAKETVTQRKECEESSAKANPSSNKLEASSSGGSVECNEVSGHAAEDKSRSKTTDSKSSPTKEVQKKPAVVSLRCEERLSSDDDDHLSVGNSAPSAPPVESRTQGIQTTEQTTATPRQSHQQATSVKATIIAKGKSSQSNQQVMVAKTATGQMYLIQGNILVPVQSVSAKDDSTSKQNSKVIIVNPVKTAAGRVGGNKLTVTQIPSATQTTVAKGSDEQEKKDNRTTKVTEKETPAEASRPSVCTNKNVESVSKPDRSPNPRSDKKISDKSPTSKGIKMSSVQVEKITTLAKEKNINKTESPTGKESKNSPDKQEKASPLSKQTNATEETEKPKYHGRGRPPGSKDKQKRKSFAHKSKRTQDDLEDDTEEPAAKRKFSKTASVVKEMSSTSTEPLTTAKRPLAVDVPTVNATKSPKRRKVSSSGTSPVKHISIKPRGGVDGESWVCSLCGKHSGWNLLGDLYGPYKTKFSKEKTDSSSTKDGKLSQKLSSPGRKSSSSSDVPADRKLSSSSDNREDVESSDVELWIHRDCGVWSPGVFMLGRTIHGLEQAVESAAQHKCTKCSEVGATLACFKRGCNKMFHYACARDSGCSFIEDNFTIFCSTHK